MTLLSGKTELCQNNIYAESNIKICIALLPKLAYKKVITQTLSQDVKKAVSYYNHTNTLVTEHTKKFERQKKEKQK